MSDDTEAEALLYEQARRERIEERAAETAAVADEAHQHERRAEKAQYLKEKLAERLASEQP